MQRQQPENNKQNVDVEKFLHTSMVTSTLSARFHVWANRAKLTMHEIED